MENIVVDSIGNLVLSLGNQHEHDVTAYDFDVSAWEGLSVLLTVQEESGEPYAVSGQTYADGILHWVVGNDVTENAGNKTICIRGLSDNAERRSALFRGYVAVSHGEASEAPEPTASWISELTIAEAERRSAETARGTAETDRATAEIQRGEAENQRETAEIGRGTAEQGRESAEQTRAQAEIGRGTAEQGRVSAEQGRVSAEQTRAQFYAGFNAELNEHSAQLAEITSTLTTDDATWEVA